MSGFSVTQVNPFSQVRCSLNWLVIVLVSDKQFNGFNQIVWHVLLGLQRILITYIVRGCITVNVVDNGRSLAM